MIAIAISQTPPLDVDGYTDPLGVLVLLLHVRSTGLPKSELSRMACVWACEGVSEKV